MYGVSHGAEVRRMSAARRMLIFFIELVVFMRCSLGNGDSTMCCRGEIPDLVASETERDLYPFGCQVPDLV